ncbi:Vacuolar cation/proton exchanger 1 [Ancistrocladus abbreviatus]
MDKHDQQWNLENGLLSKGSSSLNRREFNLTSLSSARLSFHWQRLIYNLQEVVLGTKLCILLPAIPLAILAQYCNFGRDISLGVALGSATQILMFVGKNLSSMQKIS